MQEFILKRKELILQFIKFGVVGLSNTAINFFIYYIIVIFRADWYLFANVLGWVISILNAFYWSNRFVFCSERNEKKDLWRRLLKTYLSYGATFLLTQFLLYVQVAHLGLSELIAPILSLVITIPLNFILSKFWSFKN